MIPKVGKVYMLDLGYEGKFRLIVIMQREDAQAPRALSLFVPPNQRVARQPLRSHNASSPLAQVAILRECASHRHCGTSRVDEPAWAL